MNHRAILSTLGLLTLAATTANAQLIVGSTTAVAGNPSAVYVNLSDNTGQALWNTANQKKVNGLAVDFGSSRLYSNDAARLNFWNFGSVGTAPTLIAGMYRTNDNVTFTATGASDLTFANGNLYGAVANGTTQFGRGIYKINTVSDGAATPHCVMTPFWIDPNFVAGVGGSQVSPSGLEYNPADGYFYFTNESVSASYTFGIYKVNPAVSNIPTFVTAFPTSAANYDGLTIGNGKVWITRHNTTATPSPTLDVYSYDLTSLAYDPTVLSLAIIGENTGRATAAAWGLNVPTPAAAGLLGLGGLAAMRRRR